MARALQQILSKQQHKVGFRKNKSALLMVFSNDNHNAIAQLVKHWMSSKKGFIQQNQQCETK